MGGNVQRQNEDAERRERQMEVKASLCWNDRRWRKESKKEREVYLIGFVLYCLGAPDTADNLHSRHLGRAASLSKTQHVLRNVHT